MVQIHVLQVIEVQILNASEFTLSSVPEILLTKLYLYKRDQEWFSNMHY